MIRLPHFALAFAAGSLVLGGCSGTAPANAPAFAPEALSPVLGPAIADATGIAHGALGAWTLQLDPGALTAMLEPLREMTATSFGQGDNYLLSVRPFFLPGDVRVSGIQVLPGGELKLTVQIRHPFATPADTNRPATASKRLDLHIFETHLLLVADGTDTFFGGEVTLNHGLLTNADGYRNPGPLFDVSGFDVTSANTFPYVMVGDYDSGDPGGNYNEANQGWQGAALLNPTGYGVFPQGAQRERDLILDLPPSGPVSLGLVVLAKYQDPRGGTGVQQKRANRLPDPGDPTALRYLLPHGAGDLERITVDVAGSLPDNDPDAVVGISGEILDWDAGVDVINPAFFPDNGDLSKIPENSQPTNAEADVPLINSGGTFALSVTPTFGSEIVPFSGVLQNVDQYPVTGDPVRVPGLLRVYDRQDEDDASPTGVVQQVLNEASTVPLPNPETTLVRSVRYQAFWVEVEDASTPPTGTFTFQTQEIPINADPAHAFRDIRTYTFEYKRIQAADPQGDIYYFYRWNASPNSWFVSRSTNGGDSWGAPSQIPTPFLGGLTTGNSNSLGMSVLPVLSGTSHPVIIGSSGASPNNALAMLRGADAAASATTWSDTTGAILGTANWSGACITGDLTDPTGNRAYAMGRNVLSGHPDHNRLVVYRTTNAQSATPTWTDIARPDANGGGGLNGEDNAVMAIDLAGNLHFIYRTGGTSNEVRYVKVTNPAGSPVVGPEVTVSASGTDNVGEMQLFVDASNRPLVVWEQWLGNNSNNGRIFIARGDATGTSFGTPVEPDPTSADQGWPDVIVDPGSGHVVVAYMRRGVSADEIWLAALAPDLSAVTVPPTRAHTDVPAADIRYPHLIIDVVRMRTIVCYERSGFGGPVSPPDNQYEIRSRWFTVTL